METVACGADGTDIFVVRRRTLKCLFDRMLEKRNEAVENVLAQNLAKNKKRVTEVLPEENCSFCQPASEMPVKVRRRRGNVVLVPLSCRHAVTVCCGVVVRCWMTEATPPCTSNTPWYESGEFPRLHYSTCSQSSEEKLSS